MPDAPLRLAWFSPISPQRGGVSEYSRQFLNALRGKADIVLVNDAVQRHELPPDLAWLPIVTASVFHQQEEARLPVYNMMNNVQQSGSTFDALRQHPGLTILHDLNIHGFLLDRYARDKTHDALHVDDHLYAVLLREAHGEAGLREARGVITGSELPDIPGLPCHPLITRTSRAVVCHSRWAVAQLKRNGHEAQLHYLPQGMDPINASDVRENPELVVCAGYLEPSRRLEEIVHAVAHLKQRKIPARAKFVGQISKDYRKYITQVASELKIPGLVAFEGFVEDSDFIRAMAEAAVVVHLRRPTMGETSATSLRALALAKPLLVSNTASYAEIPDDCAWKVDPDARELPLLIEYLSCLLTREDVRRTMGNNGRRYLHAEHSWEKVSNQFLEIATRTRAVTTDSS